MGLEQILVKIDMAAMTKDFRLLGDIHKKPGDYIIFSLYVYRENKDLSYWKIMVSIFNLCSLFH